MRVDAEVDGGIMRECGVMIAPGEACFPLSHRDRPICTRDFDSFLDQPTEADSILLLYFVSPIYSLHLQIPKSVFATAVIDQRINSSFGRGSARRCPRIAFDPEASPWRPSDNHAGRGAKISVLG